MGDLLFLSHRVPYPPNKGEKIRAWHMLNHLAGSHRVHLGCLADFPTEEENLVELRRVCATVGCFPLLSVIQKGRALLNLRRNHPLTLDVFYSGKLRRWVAETFATQSIESVLVFSSAMAQYIEPTAKCLRVLDMVDVDSEKWRAYAPHHQWPMSAVYRHEAQALLAFERRVALDFDITLFVSESEANHFIALAPECREHVGWVQNGVDLEQFCPDREYVNPFDKDKAHIVFTGTMDYWPNVDAVIWFVNEVLSKVQREYPHVQLHIIGSSPSRSILQLRRRGVNVTGRVSDVRPYLAHAQVVIAPLRIARGIQNKILEAMAMARPVVATLEAFQGITASPGKDLLVATGPQDMARSIIDILGGRYRDLGRAARTAIESHHCWKETLRPLDKLFQGGRNPPSQNLSMAKPAPAK